MTLLFQIPFYCLKKNFKLRKLSKVCEEVCRDYRVELSEIKITPVLGRNVDPTKPLTKKKHPLMYLVLVGLRGIREDLDLFYQWWRTEFLEHPTKYFSSNDANWFEIQVMSMAEKNKSPLVTKKLLKTHKFEYEPLVICEVSLVNSIKEVQVYFEEHSLAWQLSFPSLTMDVIRVFDFDFLLDKALFQIALQNTMQGLFPLREKDLIPFFDESISILFPSPAEWGLVCKIDRKLYP